MKIQPVLNARRKFCAASALVAAQPLTATLANTASLAQALAGDITQYIQFGEHRVGTEAELKTAQWLQQRLQGLGFATQLDRFSVRTLLEPSASLKIGDLSTTAFPQWLPPAQSLGQTVSSPLVLFESC
jgi:hypothetical protein